MLPRELAAATAEIDGIPTTAVLRDHAKPPAKPPTVFALWIRPLARLYVVAEHAGGRSPGPISGGGFCRWRMRTHEIRRARRFSHARHSDRSPMLHGAFEGGFRNARRGSLKRHRVVLEEGNRDGAAEGTALSDEHR